ncbi:hypothetical protein Nepgr_010551 [Nepenthes gracilis]|uniref:Uncharacterized protein n=1 Tax=Nepenthes gracilis TaxID=150966 RepID=A0AAD3SDD0_NEPGR|nr:hypothetical protein Nepgr_010551 [Nepenthes gracilis]
MDDRFSKLDEKMEARHSKMDDKIDDFMAKMLEVMQNRKIVGPSNQPQAHFQVPPLPAAPPLHQPLPPINQTPSPRPPQHMKG